MAQHAVDTVIPKQSGTNFSPVNGQTSESVTADQSSDCDSSGTVPPDGDSGSGSGVCDNYGRSEESNPVPTNRSDQLVHSNLVNSDSSNTAQYPGVLQPNSELYNFSNAPSPVKTIESIDGTTENDQRHFYENNIINSSREMTPKSSPLKINNDSTPNKSNRYLELKLNQENVPATNLYPSNTTDDSKETDLLLGNGTPASFPNRALVKTGSPEEEKPVLHVQFDHQDRETSNSATTIKEPCSSRSSSISSDSSSSSSSSEESFALSEARPPDGGWGWVVVAASFVVNLIADGITFSFGVIFVEFLNYFGENRGKTAWIGSLFMAMPLLSGPIASFLTDRYGCRKVTMVGSVLASIGFIVSSLANSMEVLFLTFGVLAGFGLSLCYVASVVIVAYYFDKKRSFATGLSVCGSGIGTFIFAPLIQHLLVEYGWRGTTLILAGLFLNLAVCGTLMRDLPWTSSKQKSLAKERKRNRGIKRKKNGSSAETFSVSNSTNTASVLQPIVEANENLQEDEIVNPDRLCSSLVNLPTYVRNGEKVPIEVIELLSTHKNVYNVLMQNYPNLLTPSRSFSDSGRLNEIHINKKILPIPSPLANQSPPHTNTDAAYLWWLKRNEITPPRMNPNKKLPTAYLKDLRVHRLSLTYRGAMLNINRYRLRASSCPDIYRNSMTTIAKEKIVWYSGLWDFWDLLIDMFDLSYFLDLKFLLFAISNFLLYTWYDVPYVYLADNAILLGYSENDSSMLIGIIGIVNMVGEVSILRSLRCLWTCFIILDYFGMGWRSTLDKRRGDLRYLHGFVWSCNDAGSCYYELLGAVYYFRRVRTFHRR